MQQALPSSRRFRTAAPRIGDRALLVLLGAALAGLGAAGTSLESTVCGPVSAGPAPHGAAWELRRTVAQVLWVKTHAVLHAGAEEREARPGEQVSRAGEIHFHGAQPGIQVGSGGAAEGHEDHAPHGHDGHAEHGERPGHEDGHVVVIPPRAEDFRGALGDLERAVKPYAGGDGQLYSKGPDQTVPFYRLMTWADPHFVPGYAVGASAICQAGKHADEALAFLREGERSNPDSFELQTELGHFLLVYRRDYPSAERHLARALELVPRSGLSPLQKDARTDAYRWLAILYREWGRPAQAVRVAREGLAVVGPDHTLQLTVRQRGRPVRSGPARAARR